MNNAYLFEGLGAGRDALLAIARLVPAALWDTPTGAGRFTPREVVAHLADWEPRLRDRISAALLESGARVDVWDEGELAVLNRYSECDYLGELSRFVSERTLTIELLQSLDKVDFDRTFTHPEKGLMTIDDQAAFLMGHDLYHLDQLTATL